MPAWIASKMWSEKAEIDVAPRGSASMARVMSAARREPSTPASAQNELDVAAVDQRQLLDEMRELEVRIAAQPGAGDARLEGALAGGVQACDQFLPLEGLG